MANSEASLLIRIKTAGEEALSKTRDMLNSLGAIGATAFGMISAAVVKGIGEYSEQEAAVNSLTRAMVNNGSYSKDLRDAYLDQADALSKVTLFAGENIIQAQSAFTQQARGVQLTKEATQAILDFAQAQGMDAASAANLVGKSVGTANNALARYGIEVSKTASESEKLTQVISGLNSKFGGQAQAATSGLGALKMLGKTVDDLFETLGERLAPVIVTVANHLRNLVSGGAEIETFIDIIAGGFTWATKAVYGLMTATELVSAAITAHLGSLAVAIEKILDGQITGAFDAYKSGMSSLTDELGTIWESGAKRLEEIDNASLKSKQEKRKQDENDLKTSLENKALIQEEMALKDQEVELNRAIEASNTKSALDLALLDGRKSAIYAAQVAAMDREYQEASTQGEKTAALEAKFASQELLNQAKLNEQKEMMQKDTFGKIASLSNSNNKTLAAIGKAAAITQIAIDTPMAISKALAAFPPPFNFAAAGAVGVAMAAQAAQVAGIPLAEGGIVMPRPGGTQATIGEAGQAEAVIPLDRAGEFGLGGGGTSISITVNGGMLGSETQAREFAIVLDRELMKLRRNNESLSFDEGLT